MSDSKRQEAAPLVRLVEEKPQPRYEYQRPATGSGALKAEPQKPVQREFEGLKNLCFRV